MGLNTARKMHYMSCDTFSRRTVWTQKKAEYAILIISSHKINTGGNFEKNLFLE